MTIITFPLSDARPAHPHLRRFEAHRDLGAVADLVELCFDATLDADGRRTIQNMRRTASHPGFLTWTAGITDRASAPFSGFVWETDGEIIGNVSLIPMPLHRRRILLIANVAVRPDHRRRGIARALTEAALDHCRARQVDEIWLHVREDNPGALALYSQLGFVERARRTSWAFGRDVPSLGDDPGVEILAPTRRDWTQQLSWLGRLHPESLDWHLSLNLHTLQPGLPGMVHRLFNGASPRQWAALRGGRLAAIVSWQKLLGASDRLWLAFPPDPDEAALQALLTHARRQLSNRKPLMLELPAGQATGAMEASGCRAQHTLIWMQYHP